MARLTFYGGVNEIGGNKILLEDRGQRLFLDFGFPYKRHKLFYEEYLKPRGGAGLLDPLAMGLIPPLEGIYRDDLATSGLWQQFQDATLYRKLEQLDGVLLSHAHLDEIEDLDVALRDASDVGIVAIVAVGTGYDSNQRVLEIAQQYKNLVYPALGLHPWQLGHMEASEVERTLHQIEDNLRQVVAIGEVGLDYDKRVKALVSKDRQQAILGDLMSLAKKYHKPIIIYRRYSWKDALLQAKGSNRGKR